MQYWPKGHKTENKKDFQKLFFLQLTFSLYRNIIVYI
ncbi:hypothetical protein EV282_3164 [Fictibacillus sp. BK138]|jgi:hypothetical protein|nr:hypothetical protein EV282_3164 [Fictibacillus sp. BK138]